MSDPRSEAARVAAAARAAALMADKVDETPQIHVQVRLFAFQKEIAGTRIVKIQLPVGAKVEAAWADLVRQFPGLRPGRESVRFARNSEYCNATDLLEDGDEVAIIPPVSGGAWPGRDMGWQGADGPAGGPIDPNKPAGPKRIIEIRDTSFDSYILTQLTDRLATLHDGAVVGFIGRTRLTPGTPAPGQEVEASRHVGRMVEALDYEAHESMALAMLNRIADEVVERFGVDRLAIVHRIGQVPIGDVSVAIVAVSSHRDAAFQAARYAIDETKARVPIWKAERFGDGHVWIGEPPRAGPPPLDPKSPPPATPPAATTPPAALPPTPENPPEGRPSTEPEQ